MSVTVRPDEFTLVHFDAAAVRRIVEEGVAQLDLGHLDVELDVDERTPMGGLRIESLDPPHLVAESGALEDPQRLRHLSEPGAAEAIGRLLIELRDRLDPAFGAPALDGAIAVPVRVCWDVYCLGRLARAGGRSQEQRHRYRFRVAHGFDDAADAAFDRLWSSDDLTFRDIVAISESLRSA